jgi:polar amino acid transport system substrate-binding protein
MSYRYKLKLFILGIALTFSATKSFAAEPVLICGEPWPPWLYEQVSDNKESKKPAGLHPENFRLMKEVADLDITFSILPWKRCLRDVENYSKSGDPEIAIDASFSAERAEKYHLVGPMYTISTAVFYSRNQFPEGPRSKETGGPILWINEMKDYSFCGQIGWNYDMYYDEHGIPRSNEVIRTSGGYEGMFTMLSKGRCDLIETHPVNVMGDINTGKMKGMPLDIACHKMNEDPESFYMLVSRKSPRAEKLVARLSTALIYLQRTLKWKTIKDEGVFQASPSTDLLRGCM